jgi:hypothetical protein
MWFVDLMPQLTKQHCDCVFVQNKMARMAHRSFWTSIRDELVQRGCIETFVAKSPNWGKPALCVRLVKMPSLEQQAKVNSYAAAQAGVIVAELPIDQQLYQIIEASGAEGYLQKDLRFPEIRRRHVEKLLEKFIKFARCGNARGYQ